MKHELKQAIRRCGGDYERMAEYLGLPRVLVLEAVLRHGMRAEVDVARRRFSIAEVLDA